MATSIVCRFVPICKVGVLTPPTQSHLPAGTLCQGASCLKGDTGCTAKVMFYRLYSGTNWCKPEMVLVLLLGFKSFGTLAQDKKGLYLDQTPNDGQNADSILSWSPLVLLCLFSSSFLWNTSQELFTSSPQLLPGHVQRQPLFYGGVEGHTNPCFLCYRMKSLLLKRLWHIPLYFFPRIWYSVTLFFVDFIVCGKKAIFQALVPSHQNPVSTKASGLT